MIAGLTEAQRVALRALAGCLDDSTYLAGGVAVAVRLHHRQSRDLDLFTPSFDPASRADAVMDPSVGARILGRSEGTLQIEVHGVPASWLRYRYPLLEPAERVPGLEVPLASLVDLACMKLSAIGGRGAARDFWDLHVILNAGNASLEDTLRSFERKYAAEDIGHIVRSLVYFGDAASAPLPDGLTEEHWGRIRADFENRVKAL